MARLTTLKKLILHHSCGAGIKYCRQHGWDAGKILNPANQRRYNRGDGTVYGTIGFPVNYIMEFAQHELNDRLPNPHNLTDTERAFNELHTHANFEMRMGNIAEANKLARKALKLLGISTTTPIPAKKGKT